MRGLWSFRAWPSVCSGGGWRAGFGLALGPSRERRTAEGEREGDRLGGLVADEPHVVVDRHALVEQQGVIPGYLTRKFQFSTHRDNIGFPFIYFHRGALVAIE